MGLFEYITVASSLILSTSIARLVGVGQIMIYSGGRYWVFTLAFAMVFIFHFLQFWVLWLYNVVADWTLPEFLLFLSMPTLVLVLGMSLSPLAGARPDDWRDFFAARRLQYYWCWIALMISMSASGWVIFELPLLHLQRVNALLAVALSVVGIWLNRDSADKVIVPLNFVNMLVGHMGLVFNASELRGGL
jgi:hypothetical protein